jgi:hypothetical protein
MAQFVIVPISVHRSDVYEDKEGGKKLGEIDHVDRAMFFPRAQLGGMEQKPFLAKTSLEDAAEYIVEAHKNG